MKVIQWTDTDAYFNLAAEEYVFDQLDREEDYLLLWQNRNAVVVGKHQNTIEEVNSQFIQEHGVQVVRRLSGGGAVYHDMGNLNFTFIGDAEGNKFNFQKLSQPIVQTLQQMGVADVHFSGRNDILIGEKKISGNAQFVRGNRLLHHGTLLFHSDLDMVSRVLTVKGDKIESKGVKSVRSRVTNI
ncbi:MAG TPA: lipoate--protein ligase family protein, partial [Anaerolineaceae bacterium]|nr:lipoate--protein ligase family protein [Anaerolineaceae bacterium]